MGKGRVACRTWKRANDARLQRAAAEKAEHERKLAALDRALDGQPHTPYRPPLEIVPDPPEEPVAASREALLAARELLRQGYHVARVAERTGVPVAELKYLVGKDGYRKG